VSRALSQRVASRMVPLEDLQQRVVPEKRDMVIVVSDLLSIARRRR
jgi:hypothetical protein